MIEVICLFLPTFFSFRKSDENKGIFDIIKKYAKYNVLVNLIMFTIIYMISSSKFEKAGDIFDINLTFKYLIIASLLAYYLPTFLNYLSKNYSFKINRSKSKDVKQNKKNN